VHDCLARLAAHPSEHCALCVAAARAPAAEIYRVASRWQRETTVTRARARR
jgi:hypothetical protein